MAKLKCSNQINTENRQHHDEAYVQIFVGISYFLI